MTDPLWHLSLSFQIPLDTNVTIITNSMYRFNGGAPVFDDQFGFTLSKPNVSINGSPTHSRIGD